MENSNLSLFKYLYSHRPEAVANISGGKQFSKIKGQVQFFQLDDGLIIVAQIENLPQTQNNIFAFHIHEGESCDNDFENTGGHFNPQNLPHPQHAGDMPPLFSNKGFAWQAFLTDRVKLEQILNRVVVIHDCPDDFTSQPSGNSGEKIACGKILPLSKNFSFFKRF